MVMMMMIMMMNEIWFISFQLASKFNTEIYKNSKLLGTLPKPPATPSPQDPIGTSVPQTP